MMIAEQVFAHALHLAGELTEQQTHILEALTARLREGITPEDCGTDLITAAGLMALAALAGVSSEIPTEQITAGDFTIRKGSVRYDSVAECLRAQARQIMAPYMADSFSFLGV